MRRGRDDRVWRTFRTPSLKNVMMLTVNVLGEAVSTIESWENDQTEQRLPHQILPEQNNSGKAILNKSVKEKIQPDQVSRET